MLAIESGAYTAPENAVDLGDRIIDGKKLILYVGEKAVVDIVQREVVGQHEILGPLLLRVEGSKAQALDLLYHPAAYAKAEDAARVFNGEQGDTDWPEQTAA